MSTIDHEALAISRLATQFRESSNLIAYIKVLLHEANTLEEVFCDLLESRWLDTAVGAQLDILGAIVGRSRTFIDAESIRYFGFSGHAQAGTFGDLNDPSVGARFASLGEPTTGLRELSDDEYRLYIRAKIMANASGMTGEEVIDLIAFIFDSPVVILVDGHTWYSVTIGRILSANEKLVLQDVGVVPKVAGVGVSYGEFDATVPYFGFAGVPGASGFGDLNDPTAGGVFSSLIQ